jgi:ribosomal protein S1
MDPNLTAVNTGTFLSSASAIANTEEDTMTGELSMADLLDSYPMPKRPGAYDTVNGTVIFARKDGLFVDIGGKTESFCPIEDAGDLKVGSIANFVVLPSRELIPGSEDGAVRLSHRLAKGWSRVQDLLAQQTSTPALVLDVARSNSGGESGLFVSVEGIESFLPRSESDLHGALVTHKGTTIPVKVLKAERRSERGRLVDAVVVSHKAATSALKLEYLKGLKRGDTVKGVVTRVVYEPAKNGAPAGTPRREMGVKVLVGSLVSAFVYRTEVSFNRSVKPSDVLPVGSEVDATVLDVDLTKVELRLSTKKQTVDRNALAALKPGDVLTGAISHIRYERDGGNSAQRLFQPGEENGLGVDLSNGMTGYLHRFEVSTDRSVKPSEVLPVGTPIETEVVSVDERNGMVKLSLRPMRDKEIASLREQKGKSVTGTVRSVFPNVGYFIRLGQLTEGLLHNHELRTTEGGQRETLTPGTQIDVTVKDVTENRERRRTTIALGR